MRVEPECIALKSRENSEANKDNFEDASSAMIKTFCKIKTLYKNRFKNE